MAKKVRGYVQPSGGREVYIPDFIVPLWQIEFRERHGISVDHEIAKVILQAKYTESTWKWKRAVEHIADILAERGLSKEHAVHFAKQIVELALQ
ncbi:MAG: hypothetical protein GXO25_04025 [Euryarchaeota archaeon]|nr:hypothetical protein [Euryarchaeota archaeon]